MIRRCAFPGRGKALVWSPLGTKRSLTREGRSVAECYERLCFAVLEHEHSESVFTGLNRLVNGRKPQAATRPAYKAEPFNGEQALPPYPNFAY